MFFLSKYAHYINFSANNFSQWFTRILVLTWLQLISFFYYMVYIYVRFELGSNDIQEWTKLFHCASLNWQKKFRICFGTLWRLFVFYFRFFDIEFFGLLCTRREKDTGEKSYYILFFEYWNLLLNKLLNKQYLSFLNSG